MNLNVITLSVSGWAGNTTTTNFTVILDVAEALSPTLSVLWPTNGMTVNGPRTTLRGTTSDETGSILATVVNGDGTTNTINGLIGRNGLFWIENVPLSGTNLVSIRATDATGAHATTTNIVLYPSALRVTIESTPTGDDLYLPRGTVSGTVSDPGATVSVNGVAATVESGANASGTYNWSAADVPVHGRGTAVFNVQASVGAAPGGGSQTNVNETTEIDKPAKIITTIYNCTDSSDGRYLRYEEHQYWARSYTNGLIPGPSREFPWLQMYHGHGNLRSRDEGVSSLQELEWIWSQDHSTGLMMVTNYEGQVICVTNLSEDHLCIPSRNHRSHTEFGDYVRHYFARASHVEDYPTNGNVSRQWREAKANASTRQHLFTGGKAGVQRQSLFQLQAWAQVYGKPPLPYGLVGDYTWADTPWTNALSKDLKVGDCGAPGTDSNLWVVLPDDCDPIDVTVLAEGCDHYNADVTQQKVRLELRTVQFTSASGLLKDDGSGPYPIPHWTNDVSGTTNQSSPILFIPGDKIETSTGFHVYGGGGFPVVIKGIVTGGVTNYTLWSRSTNAPSALDWSADMTTTNTLLTNTVDYFNPMTINWYFGDPSGSNYVYAGQSTNQAYVPWKAPYNVPFLHTVVDVACRNTKGLTNEADIVNNIWNIFESLAVKRADGTGPMRYWGTNAIAHSNTSNALDTTEELIKHADGQCGAWSQLFFDTLSIHRINSTPHRITPPHFADGILVGVLNGNNLSPLPAQNNNPVICFADHAVTSYLNAIYDASYGKRWTSSIAWENASVALYHTNGAVYPFSITNYAIDVKGTLETTWTPPFLP